MYLQLAEGNYLADSCGLPPLKPLHTNEANSRAKHPAEWAAYDSKKAAWDACREGKGKPTSLHPLRAVVLAPGRAFFLALLDYNVDGLAARLATEDLTALGNKWAELGGQPNKLIDFINKGKKKQRKQMNFLEKFTGPQPLADDAAGDVNPNNLTADQKAKIIAASTSLGIALGAAIPAIAPVAVPGGPILGTVIVGVMPFIKRAANKTQQDETAGSNSPDTTPPPLLPTGDSTNISWLDKTNFTGFTNKKTLLYGGGAIAATLLIRHFTKSKRKKRKIK